jgi:hypothetical protein
MNPFHDSDEVLNEWRDIADRATPPARAPRGSASGSPWAALLTVAVVLVLAAAVLVPRAIAPIGPAVGNSPAATEAVTASPATVVPSPSAIGSADSGPSQDSAATTVKTSGIPDNWQGFDWTPVADWSPLLGAADDHRVVSWAHGYAMTQRIGDTPPSEVWASADGVNWILGPEPVSLVAAGPAGLVAIGGQVVWTSPDGAKWTKAGTTSASTYITSIAGNSSGFVAITSDASGNSAVEFSSDALHWSPVTVEAGLKWDNTGPIVQEANGRLFLMGGLAAGSGLGPNGMVLLSTVINTHIWWSDDGRTWTRSTGLDGSYGAYIDAASGGLLLHTDYGSIPGGSGYLWSRDNGKTWTSDPGFGPLGPRVCEGECGNFPDGAIGSNGKTFLAVKSDGHAWTSTDGKTWKPIAWGGGSVGLNSLVVLPRGVLVYPASPNPGDPPATYGAAK